MLLRKQSNALLLTGVLISLCDAFGVTCEGMQKKKQKQNLRNPSEVLIYFMCLLSSLLKQIHFQWGLDWEDLYITPEARDHLYSRGRNNEHICCFMLLSQSRLFFFLAGERRDCTKPHTKQKTRFFVFFCPIAILEFLFWSNVRTAQHFV